MANVNIIEEFMRCKDDYAYYAEKYAQTYDETQGKKVPFKLFNQQKEYLTNLKEHHFNIVPKSRQSGISTTTALFCALYLLFTKDAKICIVAHKRDGAENFLKKILEFLHDRPKWIGDDEKMTGIHIVNESKSRVKVNNGSEVQAFASSSNSLRSFTPTLLILDECAFIPNAKELWTAASPTLSTGGRAIFISTPNGMDELFYKTYNQALDKKSDFFITYIRWWRDSRYNKGLKWEKNGQVIHEEKDEEKMMSLYLDGWIPTSDWFLGACSLLNHDQRRIAQEYQIEFLGSSQTVIPTNILQEAVNTVKDPIGNHAKYTDIVYYAKPHPDGVYICGADVASGTGSDFSTAVILDTKTMEVMAEYQGKISPDEFAHILYAMCNPYNQAMIAVDTTGGMGGTTLIVLMEQLKYPNIYYSHTRKRTLKDRLDKFSTQDPSGKVAGFYITTANRNDMVESFANMIRQGELEIVSHRLLTELRTFVFKDSGKPEHLTGYNDDLIFAYMICCFILTYDARNVMKGNDMSRVFLQIFLKANTKPNEWDTDWFVEQGTVAVEKKKVVLPKYGFRF